ncbi:MAG: helix-turn-helix transcriptional regulator [Clostridia bacterium]|nr:helix-turn-helix transcriptional regulator [Clostridia bacterium]
MDYIDRLTNLRVDRDIKQEEVAQLLGIHQSAYSKYEKRRVKLQIEDLLKLCEFYNISADYILGLTDTPRPLK